MTDPPPPGPPPPPDPPEPPDRPDETPWRTAPRPPRRGGSVWLGIVVGVLFFAALTGLNILLGPVAPWFGYSWLVLPLAYIVAAALLVARPSSTRFGSGLLIAIGVSVLLAAGVCTALLTTGRFIA